jgi:hypothetical protein
MPDNDNIDELVADIERRIAELQEELLTVFTFDKVIAINQLYELRNNLKLGFHVEIPAPHIVGVHNAHDVESLINDVARTVREHTTR